MEKHSDWEDASKKKKKKKGKNKKKPNFKIFPIVESPEKILKSPDLEKNEFRNNFLKKTLINSTNAAVLDSVPNWVSPSKTSKN